MTDPTPSVSENSDVTQAVAIKSVATLLSAAKRANASLHDKIVEANAEIRRLAEDEYLRVGYCVEGPILQQVPYIDEIAAKSSNQVIQAYLIVPDGIGIVRWDSDVLQSRWDDDTADSSEVQTLFVPFSDCSAHERSLLGPHYQSLVEGLYASFGIPGIANTIAVSSLPKWDGIHLSLGLTVIRAVRSNAVNLRCVLDAFQNAGWPESIEDPLANQQLRHRTIQVLNENLHAIPEDFRVYGVCSSRAAMTDA